MTQDYMVSLKGLGTILSAAEEKILRQVKDDEKPVEPLDGDIPKVFLTGTYPESKEFVSGELRYVSKGMTFHAYTLIKLQGTSSLQYPKKNFTVHLYADETRSIPLNKSFQHWGAHNSFVLKADFIDITHARNVVCANLWSRVVQSRPDYENLPDELKDSPNNGAIDGFPIKVYWDGYYEGLYNLTIPKGAWLFGMDKQNPDHAVLCGEFNDHGDENLTTNPCNFNTPWDGVDGDYWSIEVGRESEALTESFNAIENGIRTALEDYDTTALESVVDIPSAIDYFIFQDVILGIDGLAKNMLLATYDMTKWYLSAYDMDSTFDLYWDGTIFGNQTAWMPDDYENTGSWLLRILWQFYWDRMVERYWELRQDVLSEASILSAFEDYIGRYGDDLYIQDTLTYPDIPSATTNTLAYLRAVISERLAFLDNDAYAVSEVE